MQPTPPGWPRISAAVYYHDPKKAIGWLCAAFDFEVRMCIEGQNGRVEHSELTYGDGLIMVGGVGPTYQDTQRPWRNVMSSPQALSGRTTQNLCVHVDDVDAHCAKARKAGARILVEPKTTDYGANYWADRSYAATDLEGHIWWFMQRMRTGAGDPPAPRRS